MILCNQITVIVLITAALYSQHQVTATTTADSNSTEPQSLLTVVANNVFSAMSPISSSFTGKNIRGNSTEEGASSNSSEPQLQSSEQNPTDIQSLKRNAEPASSDILIKNQASTDSKSTVTTLGQQVIGLPYSPPYIPPCPLTNPLLPSLPIVLPVVVPPPLFPELPVVIPVLVPPVLPVLPVVVPPPIYPPLPVVLPVVVPPPIYPPLPIVIPVVPRVPPIIPRGPNYGLPPFTLPPFTRPPFTLPGRPTYVPQLPPSYTPFQRCPSCPLPRPAIPSCLPPIQPCCPVLQPCRPCCPPPCLTVISCLPPIPTCCPILPRSPPCF